MEKLIVKIKDLYLGPSYPIRIQTMSDIKTSRLEDVIAQSNNLVRSGAELIRYSVLDEDDAKAFEVLSQTIKVPLIADIHFDYHLALKAIEYGADKIRINPGNTPLSGIKEIVKACKDRHIPIRIGLNSGSLQGNKTPQDFLKEVDRTLEVFESLGFQEIVLALKSSDPLLTYKLNKLAYERYPYPLHLGVTEAGYGDEAIIKSIIALAPLLQDGIGSTIRISLTDTPLAEVQACKHLLRALGLKRNVPTLISCPTCGRTMVNVKEMAKRVATELTYVHKDITIAVMGCPVNGPGEAKEADYGIAGCGNNRYVIFSKGKILQTLDEEAAYSYLRKIIHQ